MSPTAITKRITTINAAEKQFNLICTRESFPIYLYKMNFMRS